MNDTQGTVLLTGRAKLSKASLATGIVARRLRIKLRANPNTLCAKRQRLKAFLAQKALAGIDLVVA